MQAQHDSDHLPGSTTCCSCKYETQRGMTIKTDDRQHSIKNGSEPTRFVHPSIPAFRLTKNRFQPDCRLRERDRVLFSLPYGYGEHFEKDILTFQKFQTILQSAAAGISAKLP